ncbi:hypothetical protein C1646_771141 [Rhizophagus diaphanus]|nr:hypothetical protein C1646_771141 [Rhizophagus diaphanus] [Rhizophagus sp. MUCL 43196]
MPLQLRKQLKNHFVLSFVPFGGEFDDVMKPIVDEIKNLESGILITINRQKLWLTAALVPKEQLTDSSFDIKLNARYHHITDEKIEELNTLVQESASQKTISKYCTKYSLRKHPSILDQLTWNRHLQVPQDAYHAVAEKIQRLMECTFLILKSDGEVAFINYWKNLETSAGCLTFTEQAYKELEKLLRIEHNILLKLFSDNFENLPNLHINKHHVQNA